ncbi:hypothetical protein wTpre_885 [Wolbachia endosymbiont of Trichogramma pretiosum]|nr:hypothetical protein wTpre_885 [Wolbachia endosymbiont of Trichogramma pretiosum]
MKTMFLQLAKREVCKGSLSFSFQTGITLKELLNDSKEAT